MALFCLELLKRDIDICFQPMFFLFSCRHLRFCMADCEKNSAVLETTCVRRQNRGKVDRECLLPQNKHHGLVFGFKQQKFIFSHLWRLFAHGREGDVKESER